MRERLRHPDARPPNRAKLSIENPHTCKHCETEQLLLQVERPVVFCWDCNHRGAGKRAESGEYVCTNCGRHLSAAGDESLLYSATLGHTISQAADTARFGCELYRWITAKTARYISSVTKNWDAPEVMEAIVAHCRYETTGLSSVAPPQDGRCVLHFRLVYDGAASVEIRKGPLFLGSMVAWATTDDPASKYILSRPYERDVKSIKSIQFIKNCFLTCMERHSWCRTDQIGHLALGRKVDEVLPPERVGLTDIPTRLIDVGTMDAPTLRLVETADNNGALKQAVSVAGFMALSYCWGGDQPAKLLKEKVADYKRSIHSAALTPTLRDAVWVARMIGSRYLWIDSLCIHQDDLDGQGNNPDKALEITRMSSYYGCATITLCAASAERAVNGFLGRREDARFEAGPVRMRLKFKDNGTVIGQVYLLEELDPPPIEPTTTRGWTLQESLLSRRILIFSRRQVYWSCLNSFGGCGGNIANLTDRTIPGIQSLVDGIYPAGSLIDQPTWAQWGVIVKDYTERKLGRDGDKLWAVSALAQHIFAMSQKRGEDPVYAAGLLVDWSNPGTWLPQLLWYPETEMSRRPSVYRAPSWSWASIEGPARIPSWRSGLAEYATVVSWESELQLQTAPYGALTGGHLVLEARVQPMAAVEGLAAISWGDWGKSNQTDNRYDSGPWGKDEGSEGRWALVLLPDCSEDMKTIEASLNSGRAQSSEPLLVGMLELTTGQLIGVSGIIVIPEVDNGGDRVYKRIGSFQLRAGLQAGGRPGSSVFKFFGGADTVVHKIV
ncbi:heterokaryon incompatibility protein-domain-containing protein [Lasiosphaeris hirsuta]|uniref:Heterokaryon incompatibility protein-domain-containing protein n=1 Tax=Lasiosphaeris hirsuta TaxID=260670 RepID=A0AA40ANP3_9PEZI|nr:heterokaryon incompatibility protein-domain-containing protein [Lasiosphaeris hirsuta]